MKKKTKQWLQNYIIINFLEKYIVIKLLRICKKGVKVFTKISNISRRNSLRIHTKECKIMCVNIR